MRAFVTQKISSSKTAYGEKVGGKNNNATPEYIETASFENVSSVVETTAGGIPVYEITHMTGEDIAPHTTRYAIANYNVSVIGG